jgi:uncharacterized protein YerC
MEPASLFKHAVAFLQKRDHVEQMFDDLVEHHDVETLRAKWQAAAVKIDHHVDVLAPKNVGADVVAVEPPRLVAAA